MVKTIPRRFTRHFIRLWDTRAGTFGFTCLTEIISKPGETEKSYATFRWHYIVYLAGRKFPVTPWFYVSTKFLQDWLNNAVA